MSDPPGKLQTVKSRLNYYVSQALGGYASNDWKIKVWRIGTWPVSTMRFPDIDIRAENFGRETPQSGMWAYFRFTVQIHQERDDQYSPEIADHYQVLDAADDLIDYFLGIRGNQIERDTYGIHWIDGISADEENPRNVPRDVAAVRVSGVIQSKWLDVTTTTSTTSTSTTSTSTSTTPPP